MIMNDRLIDTQSPHSREGVLDSLAWVIRSIIPVESDGCLHANTSRLHQDELASTINTFISDKSN
jgi:hypothetical protein